MTIRRSKYSLISATISVVSGRLLDQKFDNGYRLKAAKKVPLMKFAYGKEIPTSLEELVDPRKSALVIIDVQNDYAKENGRLLFPEMIQNLKEIINEARRIGVLVIYIQDTLLPARFSDSPAWVRHYMIPEKTSDPEAIGTDALDESKGHQVVDEIKPLPHELMIKKYRSSAFVGTSLDLLLRSNGIRNFIATGLVTQGCVESTCRDASNEYFVVVLRDCVESNRKELHEANLKIMECRYDVVTSRQVLDIWKKFHSTRETIAVGTN
ncbi:MAG TPA: isochorismatase family cysteine hydrolase [Candidatus Bathyarchaeia archaeon]|nr:isochorismatase family cysteine hydrolase [Candidatus Bathyarchaeia archaeon]